ncbi:MAG: lipopolysaccharide export system permease protein [Chitinophagales bacterium]
MKKLDKLLILSYLGPLLLTFCIALFVLDMMFLWKYVDDLIGKGIDGGILAELMFYASAVQVPMAFPLAVLVASIMTFGSLGEQFELTAVKASGISLFRFMRPLIFFTILMSFGAFYFSNNVLPVANLEFSTLLSDIRKQKPALAFEEHIFNNDIQNYSIRIKGKSDDDKTVYDIMIYDHTENRGNNHVILADSAEFGYLNDGGVMSISLHNGSQFKEETMPIEKNVPAKMMVTRYKSWEKHLDLSAFKLERQDQTAFTKLHRMLNLRQLQNGADSVMYEMQDERDLMMTNISRYYLFIKAKGDTSGLFDQELLPLSFYTEFDSLIYAVKLDVLKSSLIKARNMKNIIVSKQEMLHFKSKDLIQYRLYMHQKFSLSIACIVLFFIGAPLGAIIKKGGFGWPMLLAVIFFVIYIVTSIMGEKTAEQMVLAPWQGIWLSTFLLLPVGMFLTWKAKNDSPIFTGRFYKNLFLLKKKVKGG